jgi:hypothetical protein
MGYCVIMGFAMGILIGASLSCSLGYLLGAIMWTAKQADITQQNLRFTQFEQVEREP